MGETIEAALNAAPPTSPGYTHDITLGEAALTSRDARALTWPMRPPSAPSARPATVVAGCRSRHLDRCRRSILATAGQRVSVLTSFIRAFRPWLAGGDYEIGVNIDAEEADRLELSRPSSKTCR